ncbi:unnamed protein product [Caretta caretta]
MASKPGVHDSRDNVNMTTETDKEWLLQKRQKDREMQQKMQQDTMGFLMQQTQMLQNTAVIYAQRLRTPQPFQSQEKTPWLLLSTPLNIPGSSMVYILTTTHSTPDTKENSYTYTDL